MQLAINVLVLWKMYSFNSPPFQLRLTFFKVCHIVQLPLLSVLYILRNGDGLWCASYNFFSPFVSVKSFHSLVFRIYTNISDNFPVHQNKCSSALLLHALNYCYFLVAIFPHFRRKLIEQTIMQKQTDSSDLHQLITRPVSFSPNLSTHLCPNRGRVTCIFMTRNLIGRPRPGLWSPFRRKWNLRQVPIWRLHLLMGHGLSCFCFLFFQTTNLSGMYLCVRVRCTLRTFIFLFFVVWKGYMSH